MKNMGKMWIIQRGKHSIGQDSLQVLLKSQAIQEVHQDPRTTMEIKIQGSSSKSLGEMGLDDSLGESLSTSEGLALQWSLLSQEESHKGRYMS